MPRPRSPSAALLALAASCITPRARPPVARVVDVAIDPPASSRDRVARSPTVTLAFDRPLADPLATDAVWLLADEPAADYLADARRATLSATHAARRLDAEISLHPSDPSRLRVRPRAPLLPDAAFALVTTARLVARDGAPVAPPDDAPAGPIALAFRVAPAPECPALARLAFPLHDAVPPAASRLVVSLDRPVVLPAADAAHAAPVASLLDADGAVVPAAVVPSCLTRGHFACIELAPRRALAASAAYSVALHELADARGFAPQPVDLAFTVAHDAPPRPRASAALVCATDELARPPFCVRVLADAVEVRGATLAPASLRVRAGAETAESPAGTEHRVRVPVRARASDVALTAWVVALDGAVAETHALAPVVAAPPLPALRITEVLARPRSGSSQEFVEVLNPGPSAAQLDGLVIATPSGASRLPALLLPALARAVIVGSGYDPRGGPAGLDEPVAPGTYLVRLTTASIASRGLSDRGTDVWIAGAGGHVITRAPTGHALRQPRAGVSLVRADDRMKEDDPAAWSYHAGSGSSPGQIDQLR